MGKLIRIEAGFYLIEGRNPSLPIPFTTRRPVFLERIDTVRRAATVLLLALAVQPFEAFAADKVSPADIQATFGGGTPFTAIGDGGKIYTMILKADGTALMAARKS